MYIKTVTPVNIQEGIWNEDTCVRRTGGYTVDKSNLPSDLKYIAKGTCIAYDKTSAKAIVVKTAKVYEAAEAKTDVKIEKGHILVVGDVLDGQEITKIDTTDTNFDVITLKAAITANVGDVLADGNVSKILGLAYATVNVEDYTHVTPTLQAYEIEEDSLPYPINSSIKTALTVRHAFLNE